MARNLRRTMTLPEVLLWRQLRTRPAGIKFRRQHPAGSFVLDFYSSDARLAVEIDGTGHDMGDRPQRDEARDAMLNANGIAVLRIPASDVFDDLDAVLRHIVAEASARLDR